MKVIYTFITTLLLVMSLSLVCRADVSEIDEGLAYGPLLTLDAQEPSLASPADNETPEMSGAGRTPSEFLGLSIEGFIKMVKEKNERIIAQQLELEISREAVVSARSIFEPALVSAYGHEEAQEKYTEEEKAKLFWAYDERNDRTNQYNVAVEGLVPTGGRLSFGYTLADISNNFNQDIGNEYQTVLGANVTQPLLKNGGVEVTMANIRVAEADSEVALQTYRRQMMQVVLDAAGAFWDLYLAQEKHRIRKDSVHIAEQILKDNRERVRFGKMAETEVLEAEAGLAVRRSLEIAARQDIVAAMNIVRTFVSCSDVEARVKIEVNGNVQDKAPEPRLDVSIEKALRLRPDYASAHIKLDREDIRIAYAKNQRWPQLDLKGTYGLNGLDDSMGSSWDEAIDGDYRTWTVGFELKIPLQGDMKSRSELRAAKHRKRQALLETKAVEVEMANGIHSAVRNVLNTGQQVRQYGSAVKLKQRLLEVELMRLEAGKSNSRLVLEKEEDLHQVKEAHVESVVRNKKAALELEMEEGSLLLSYGVDVEENQE